MARILPKNDHQCKKCSLRVNGKFIPIEKNGNGAWGIFALHANAKLKKKYTGYMHMSKILVKEGDMVKAGQLIGKAGATEWSRPRICMFCHDTRFTYRSIKLIAYRNSPGKR